MGAIRYGAAASMASHVLRVVAELILGTIVKLVASLMMVALFGAGWWWNRGVS